MANIFCFATQIPCLHYDFAVDTIMNRFCDLHIDFGEVQTTLLENDKN